MFKYEPLKVKEMDDFSWGKQYQKCDGCAERFPINELVTNGEEHFYCEKCSDKYLCEICYNVFDKEHIHVYEDGIQVCLKCYERNLNEYY